MYDPSIDYLFLTLPRLWCVIRNHEFLAMVWPLGHNVVASEQLVSDMRLLVDVQRKEYMSRYFAKIAN